MTADSELADLLTGGPGSEGMLRDLEDANAFVVSLDTARSWFRLHHLFADLLQLQLRQSQPGEVTALHRWQLTGWPDTGTRWKQSATRRRRGTGGRWPADCWPTTGQGFI
jgi:LuxR family transcriptional regulator, maltose regulon positive regulatory protein